MRRINDNGSGEIDSVGWYGKLPAAGDFVHRRMPRELIAWWDNWLQTSLGAAFMTGDSMRRTYAQAPMWNFAIPASLGSDRVQLGCIAPSHDRVGRRYPLLALCAIDPTDYSASLIDGAAPFFRKLGTALLGATRHGYGPEQLEHAVLRAESALSFSDSADLRSNDGGGDIMSILNNESVPVHRPAGLAWPELPACFNPHSYASYWWTNQTDGAPLQTFIHSGALNAALFSTLFVPVAGVRRPI